jgi:hypothetical protein
MSNLRALTDAELDIVCGGSLSMSHGCGTATSFVTTRPTSGGCGENLVKELVADILRILDGNNCCGGGLKRANLA